MTSGDQSQEGYKTGSMKQTAFWDCFNELAETRDALVHAHPITDIGSQIQLQGEPLISDEMGAAVNDVDLSELFYKRTA